MKVVGIIAEYNPFHKGHEYQIQQLKKVTGADYVIIAMSGNFLQRGTPALCDKFTRTKMALSCGADLVLELPTIWATGSAEYFAQGGVRLLANTGVVTHLGFGAESEDLNGLLQVSSILREEPDIYRVVLGNSLRSGNPFPVARKQALITSLPQLSAEKLAELLDSPNNVLALEYLKALPEHIAPVLIPRKGAGYHSTDIHDVFPSATAIRETVLAKSALTDTTDNLTVSTSDLSAESSSAADAVSNETADSRMDSIANAMPEQSYQIFREYMEQYHCMELDDFSSMLWYPLLSLSQRNYSDFADCSRDLSNKIKNHLNDYVTIEDFIQNLKTKDMTYTRISRSLLHILLNITQADYQIGKAMGYTPYIRVLGFRKDSSELLSAIKQHTDIPMITKVADASRLLSYETNKMFEGDLFASALYYQCMAEKSELRQKPLNEFTHPLVIL